MNIIDDPNGCAHGMSAEMAAEMTTPEDTADMLDDQVAGLYRRAATFEEEEFLLNREVEELQTELNRLRLKLEAMRAERDRVMDRIESISGGPCYAGASGLVGSINNSPFSFAEC